MPDPASGEPDTLPIGDPVGIANAAAIPPDYAEIARRLKDGSLVPFFGAGASAACGFPSGRVLADRLVKRGEFPGASGQDDLALVASYLVQTKDSVTLRGELRDALNVTAEPSRLHRLLADPRFPVPIFVTTNYDDLVERALQPRTPWIVVDRGRAGTVWCQSADGSVQECESKNLGYVITDDRPIVLKLHGSLDRKDRDNDSFLITEEDYVEFLGRTEGNQIPQKLAVKMKQRSFLFLGYALRDWNVRVMLRKLALTRNPSERVFSWAILRNLGEAERKLWERRDILMHSVDLDAFASELEKHL